MSNSTATTPIYAQYDFESMDEFFNYIVESRISGQPQQVTKLLTEMSPTQVGEFIKWVDLDHNDVYMQEAGKYCHNAAIQVLTDKATPAPVKPGQITSLSVIGKEWFDKVNGNSYFSARIIVNDQKIVLPFQYSYESMYLQQAKQALINAGFIVSEYGIERYCRENKIPATFQLITKCLQREVKEWGK